MKRSLDDSLSHLDRRILTMSGLSSGEFSLFCGGEKNQRVLLSLSNSSDAITSLCSSPELGSGTYGQVKVLKDEENQDVAVAKISGYQDDLVGARCCPFRPEHVEPRLLCFLWDHFAVKQKVTPHLIAPFGKHVIIDGSTPEHRENNKLEEQEGLTSLVYMMERAVNDNMNRFLRTRSNRLAEPIDRFIKVFMFHICYTMGAILCQFPTFRHNDLKDDNILLHACSSTGYTQYSIYEKTFWVPRVGHIALLSDFDFACINGYMFDNLKVLDHSFFNSVLSIGEGADEGRADLFLLVTSIRNFFGYDMSAKLRTEFQALFGYAQDCSYNRHRLMPNGNTPSIRELLESSFFSEFTKVQSADEVFAAPSERMPITWAPWDPSEHVTGPGMSDEDIRFAPVLLPPNLIADLPSARYFAGLKMTTKKFNGDSPTPYSDPILNRILDVFLESAYHEKSTDGREKRFHKFARKHMPTFRETLQERIKSAIKIMHLPLRWWYAAFMCAFSDIAREMKLVQPKQECWAVDDWSVLFYEEAHLKPVNLLHFALQWNWVKQSCDL